MTSTTNKEFTPEEHYSHDVFLSSPILGFDSFEKYLSVRKTTLELIAALKDQCEINDVFFIGQQIETEHDYFHLPYVAVEDAFQVLRESPYYVLVYPERLISSVLIEAGYALALGKFSVYFVRDSKDLPNLLQVAPQIFSYVKIYEYKDSEDLIKKIRWYGAKIFRERESLRITEKTQGEAYRMDTSTPEGRLRVFLCHASEDKPEVRNLYKRLKGAGVDPWLDEEDLLGGQVWEDEIPEVVRAAHAVLVCLSQKSVSKAGYIQKEIKYVLDVADQQPQGTIYVIPLKLEECQIPERLNRWHGINYFQEDGFGRLMLSLRMRAQKLGLAIEQAS
jgi:hypothetical protein